MLTDMSKIKIPDFHIQQNDFEGTVLGRATHTYMGFATGVLTKEAALEEAADDMLVADDLNKVGLIMWQSLPLAERMKGGFKKL